MRAFQLVAWQTPPELCEVPVPEPGPGQILLKVGGAGACHSDLHLMSRPAPKRPVRIPFTLGMRTRAGSRSWAPVLRDSRQEMP